MTEQWMNGLVVIIGICFTGLIALGIYVSLKTAIYKRIHKRKMSTAGIPVEGEIEVPFPVLQEMGTFFFAILGKVILVALAIGVIYALISGIRLMWTHPMF